MGEVKVEVSLENTLDSGMARRGVLSSADVRQFNARLLVDSGAIMLALPQDYVEALGLDELGKAVVTCADERKEERPIAGPVTVRVGNRFATVNCVVLPPNAEPLLGQIVLEMTDVRVDCRDQKLVPRPESPFLPELKLK
jgi:predicted aspartyl protease